MNVFGTDSGFGMTMYTVPKDATRIKTDDFENNSAFGKCNQKCKDAGIKARDGDQQFTPREQQQFETWWMNKFLNRVISARDYEASATNLSKEFATFFSKSNAMQIFKAIKERSGNYPDPDTTFEMMMSKFASNPSHSSSTFNVNRENRSAEYVDKHIKSLNDEVFKELLYEVKISNETWDVYAKNMNFRYDEFDVPEAVNRTNLDGGWVPTFDFLLPND
jgi:hypothetical protein